MREDEIAAGGSPAGVSESPSSSLVDLESSTVSERNILDLLGLLAASTSGAMFTSLALRTLPTGDLLIGMAAACAVCIAALLAAARFNDLLIEDRSFNAMLLTSAVLTGAGSLLMFVNAFFGLLAVLGFVILLMTWVNYLVIQRHFLLNLILMSVFLLSGAVELFSAALSSPMLMSLIAALFSFVSLIAAYIARSHYRSSIDSYLTREESRNNMQARKSNFSKTFADGLAWIVSFILLTISLEGVQANPLYGGIFIIVAAAITCLFRYMPNLNFEIFMNWHMVLIYAVLLLAFPFMDNDLLRILVSGLAFTVAMCYVLILLAGMSEFAKSIKVSCYYEFGREGSFFFMGALIGLILYFAIQVLFPLMGMHGSQVMSAFCSVSLVLLVWLNIDIVKGGYPFPEEFGIAKEKRMSPHRGASWKVKINLAAQKYSLSPRQKEVMALLARGRNANYIMTELCVSNATTKSHIYSVYRKLGVHTQQELIDLIEEIEEEDNGFT